MTLSLRTIASLRLQNQQLVKTDFRTPQDLVHWLGAMQAQDYHMAKWAVGIRLPGSQDADVEKALNEGTIIRIHALRPTWHFVAQQDVRWILDLSSAQLKASSKSRDKQLELTEKLYTKSNGLIEKALSAGEHLTREELMTVLQHHHIAVDTQRAIHFMFRAELEGIACSGKLKGKNHTYALQEDRIHQTKKLTREEALAKLADRYFTSHAPATLKDFTWWSGLSITEARQALALVKDRLSIETLEGQQYWLPASYHLPKTTPSSLYLLPAFDELIISYKDRSACLDTTHQKTAFTTNGIFRPIILLNGKGIGVWSRTIKKNNVLLEPTFFEPVSKSTQQLVRRKAEAYGLFLNKTVELLHP